MTGTPHGAAIHRGTPEHIRSDNGPEFTAKTVRECLGRLEVGTLFIEPGNPWENGYVESLTNILIRSLAPNADLQFFANWC